MGKKKAKQTGKALETVIEKGIQAGETLVGKEKQNLKEVFQPNISQSSETIKIPENKLINNLVGKGKSLEPSFTNKLKKQYLNIYSKIKNGVGNAYSEQMSNVKNTYQNSKAKIAENYQKGKTYVLNNKKQVGYGLAGLGTVAVGGPMIYVMAKSGDDNVNPNINSNPNPTNSVIVADTTQSQTPIINQESQVPIPKIVTENGSYSTYLPHLDNYGIPLYNSITKPVVIVEEHSKHEEEPPKHEEHPKQKDTTKGRVITPPIKTRLVSISSYDPEYHGINATSLQPIQITVPTIPINYGRQSSGITDSFTNASYQTEGITKADDITKDIKSGGKVIPKTKSYKSSKPRLTNEERVLIERGRQAMLEDQAREAMRATLNKQRQGDLEYFQGEVNKLNTQTHNSIAKAISEFYNSTKLPQ